LTCGLHVCHYLEDELRAAAGQGHASQGWPALGRLKTLREYIAKGTATLNAAGEKWAAELSAAEDKRTGEKAKLVERALELLEKKGKLEEYHKRQAEIAVLMMTVGASAEAVPLPKGFAEKPKAKPKAKALEAKEEEPPEAEAKKEKPPEVEGEKEEQPEAEAKKEEQPEAEAKKEKPPEVEGEKEEQPEVEGEKDDVVVVEATAASEKAAKLKAQYDEIAIELAMESYSVEDLSLEHRAAYEKVKEHGLGVCSKCRWRSGCLNCDERKAWRYYVRLPV